MNPSNTEGYTAVSDQEAWETVVEILTERAGLIREDPEYLLHFLQHELTEPDRRVVEDFGIRRLLTDTYREALRSGADGWIDDMLAFRKPWGFRLSAIQIPTLLWHGQDDVFSPASHTRWLAGQIPAEYCTVEMQPGAAHFDAVGALPRMLTWLSPLGPARPGYRAQNGCGSSARTRRRPARRTPIVGWAAPIVADSCSIRASRSASALSAPD